MTQKLKNQKKSKLQNQINPPRPKDRKAGVNEHVRLCMKSNGSSILIAKGLTAAGATVLKHNVTSFVEKAGGKLNGTLYIVR